MMHILYLQLSLSMKWSLHAHHLRVEQMLFAKNITMLAHVLVYLNTSVTHTRAVDRSVSSIQIVHQIKPAFGTSAKTPALVHVVQMLTVKLSTICPLALAYQDTQEIHSNIALSTLHQLNVSLFLIKSKMKSAPNRTDWSSQTSCTNFYFKFN